MPSFVCGATAVAVAAASIALPALFADPSDAERIGFYGRDYEGSLCGQVAWRAGAPHRDLRGRPYMYWMNTTTAVCARACPAPRRRRAGSGMPY